MNTFVSLILLSVCFMQGFCLQCHECPASSSLAECESNQKVVNCSDEFNCMTVKEIPLAAEGEQSVEYFRHTCAQAEPCTQFCNGKDHPCEILTCCNTDLCN
ncbi:ly6/PLAUR domain-containing protein 1 [Nematostella vectensis]|uniref:ly6/PLAUR domain-containing protein 1 n=1 Tax=Nematostella vectensis TaxID=45351 RepID=UPI0013904EE9|nr:ly6/PLAUR domain-containing protein 1 [Nematostella vectensis]